MSRLCQAGSSAERKVPRMAEPKTSFDATRSNDARHNTQSGTPIFSDEHESPGKRMASNRSANNKKKHHAGHRERLRERFLLTEDANNMAPYELLELLLFLFVPRIDVKPLAKELMQHYGNNFAELLNAPRHELHMIKGMNERIEVALAVIRAVVQRAVRDEVRGRPVIGAWDQLQDYLRTKVGSMSIEQVRLLLLDSGNRLIHDEAHQTGTVDRASVFPREIVKLAVKWDASALIIVHNHPSGDITPSKADIEITKRVQRSCQAVGIALHDHIIVGASGCYSMRSHQLI